MKRYENNIVLAFGDTHFPYEHRDTFEFLADINSDYRPDRVINMGDLLDSYGVSQYPKDIDHPDSWSKEIKKARKKVTKLGEIFKSMEVLESNHDDRAYKKSRVAGIPREFLLPYRKVISAPDSWKWHRDLTITVDSTREQMFFAHTAAGGCLNVAQRIGKTAVLGHQHTKQGCVAYKPTSKKTVWGIDVGCLISDKGSPFSYNKAFRGRPINGCVIILEGIPTMIPLG